MDPRPCTVLEGADRWPGTVLAWRRSEGAWVALVRFSRDMAEGYPLVYEYELPASSLLPR